MLQHNWELSAHGLGRNCLLDFLNMAKRSCLTVTSPAVNQLNRASKSAGIL